MSTKEKNKIIIGLTGSVGSGCSYIADIIINKEHNGHKDFTKYSLSDILRIAIKEKHPQIKLMS